MSAPNLLAGLRVLELGDGIAGAATTSQLSQLGATVTAVTDPSSLHRRARPTVRSGERTASALSILLDRSKHLVTTNGLDLDAIERMVAPPDAGGATAFDLVVVDRVGGLGGPLAPVRDVDAYLAFVARANRAAWVSISAFGLSGERRGDFAGELTLAAASGIVASVRDKATGQPLKLAGHQSLLNAAQAAALASCHAVDLGRAGDPAHLDLSAVEANIAMGPTIELIAELVNAGGPGGAQRYGAPARMYPCRDGLLRISAMEDHQWRGVVVAMGEPAWAAHFDLGPARIEGKAEIDARISEWTATLTKVDAETLLQSHGVPATAMRSPLEVLDSPQFAYRGSFERVPLPDGRDLRIIGSPCRVVGAGRPESERRGRSLRDLNVVEVGHVLAVPLAGALLGALGANVTKVEDVKRVDMYRRRGPYIDDVASPERAAYFAAANHSKQSAAFDVDASPERLESLLDAADVVVENVGGSRAARLGIGASDLVSRHPHVLAVSSSGFGQDGPFAAYRAYAYNINAACCLAYLTRTDAGDSAEVDPVLADLASGYAVATVVAAWTVGPAGNAGMGVDFAMADLVVARFNEFVAAASIDPDSDAAVDRANETFPCAPSGVYATQDGWIAIAVQDDEQFTRLASSLGDERLARAHFARAADRAASRADVDALIADVTRERTAASLASELRRVGVDAEEVVMPRALAAVGQLASRGFFTQVDHPEWGRRPLIGIPWRPLGQPAIALGPPPLFEPLAAVAEPA